MPPYYTLEQGKNTQQHWSHWTIQTSWALFLSKDVGHDFKPINNLLILSFPSLS